MKGYPASCPKEDRQAGELFPEVPGGLEMSALIYGMPHSWESYGVRAEYCLLTSQAVSTLGTE